MSKRGRAPVRAFAVWYEGPMIESFLDATPEIHPEAYVHPSAVIIGRVKVGARSSVWPNVTLRGDDGDIVIGEETSIQDNSVLHMFEGLSDTMVGNRVTVGHGVTLHGCRIEDECIVGMGSTILDGVVVGTGSIVGAGTVIPARKVIPPGSLVLGNPFKIVRTCTDEDREFIGYSWRVYVKRAAQYAARDADRG